MNNEEGKKSYETPRLIYFGDIREITRTTRGTASSPDGIGTLRTH